MYNDAGGDDRAENSQESPVNSELFCDLKDKQQRKKNLVRFCLHMQKRCLSLILFDCFHKENEEGNIDCFSHFSNTWYIGQILEYIYIFIYILENIYSFKGLSIWWK